MKKRLTKTEAMILEHLKTHRSFGASIETGRKPYTGGKVRPYGMREWNACESLLRKGLIEQIHRGGFNITGHGWTTHVSELSVCLKAEE